MDPTTNGVAHVRFVEPHPREFYGVFYQGVLQPTQFKSDLEAREHLVALLQQKIEAQPE